MQRVEPEVFLSNLLTFKYTIQKPPAIYILIFFGNLKTKAIGEVHSTLQLLQQNFYTYTINLS